MFGKGVSQDMYCQRLLAVSVIASEAVSGMHTEDR